MQIYTNPHSESFAPPFEVFNGEQTPHADVPSRSKNIKDALAKTDFAQQEMQFDLNNENSNSEIRDLLAQIHTTEYLNFLEDQTNRLAATVTEAADELASDVTDANSMPAFYPSVFAYTSRQIQSADQRRKFNSTQAGLGRFIFDTYTPIVPELYQLALSSANLAMLAAKSVANGEGKHAYALCRPSGHHAMRAMAGGYCYLNNCAVAVETIQQTVYNHFNLSAQGQDAHKNSKISTKTTKIATLDIDFHHGNGTQDIFYERSDVFTVSIHADPNQMFPFMDGHSTETGSGQGQGYNMNYPLALGIGDDEYLEVLSKALEKISEFSADYLVVSLGTDTHKDDPISAFKLSTNFFRLAAQQISTLGLPTVVVQEGGYATKVIGTNVVEFLSGF